MPSAITEEKLTRIPQKKALDNVYKEHRLMSMKTDMSNTQNPTTVRNTARNASARRSFGLNGLLQGVFFALAVSFTAALVFGVVH